MMHILHVAHPLRGNLRYWQMFRDCRYFCGSYLRYLFISWTFGHGSFWKLSSPYPIGKRPWVMYLGFTWFDSSILESPMKEWVHWWDSIVITCLPNHHLALFELTRSVSGFVVDQYSLVSSWSQCDPGCSLEMILRFYPPSSSYLGQVWVIRFPSSLDIKLR